MYSSLKSRILFNIYFFCMFVNKQFKHVRCVYVKQCDNAKPSTDCFLSEEEDTRKFSCFHYCTINNNLGKSEWTRFLNSTFFNFVFCSCQQNWNKIKKSENRTRKLWYLLLRIYWLLLPKIYFWKRDWALDSLSTQFWDFPQYFLISE